MTNWPVVSVASVLTQNKDYIDHPEHRLYSKLSVKLYGRGVELGAPVHGESLKMSRHQIAKAGQVILSEIWGKKGAIGIVPLEGEGALCTSHFFLFDIKHDKVDPGWLLALFRANYLTQQLNERAYGTTGYAAVRPKDLLAITIPLPPLSEQQQIVAKVERLAGKIEEARGLRTASLQLAKQLMQAKLSAVYDSLCTGYGQVELESACESITDGDHITPSFTESGVKFIFVGNVSSGQLHFQDCKFVDPDYFATVREYRKPRRGDILYSAVGATLGIPAIVETDEVFCFQRHIAILKPQPHKVVPRFMWHMLQSGRLFATAWANTTGSAQPTIPLRAIRKLPFVLPPVKRQVQIIEDLDAMSTRIEQLRALQAETGQELSALLPSLLDRTFHGRLKG